jgi:AraC-like DNA-binding protein
MAVCRVQQRICSLPRLWNSIKNLAVRLAAATIMGAFPLIDYLVATSETAGEGLRQLARYLRLAGAPYALILQETENDVHVIYDRPENTFGVEFGVTLAVLRFYEETEQRLLPRYVSFMHRPDDIAECEHILGCPVVPNKLWSGFALPPESCELPLRRRDPVLRAVLEQQAAELASRLPATNDAAYQVRRALAARIASGDVQIGSIARVLATSTRSLQRRLADEGWSYQELLDLTRRDAAKNYLGVSTLSIGEVGYLLGYSEPAAFHRAFKRWNGIGPQAFRERIQANVT